MDLQVTKVMLAALRQTSDGAFQQAAAALSQAQGELREALRQKLSGQIQEVIHKLSGGGQLSAEEIESVKMLIVGDAESYLKAENDANVWNEEYKRLIGVIQGFENKDCSEQDLARLNGILEDAIRVSYSIANVLEKKERIAKLDQALADGVDEEEKEILVRVLVGKLRPAEY